MQGRLRHSFTFGIAVLTLMTAFIINTPAQGGSKAKDDAPQSPVTTTTLDTWKKELPQYEETGAPNAVTSNAPGTAADATPAEIEKALTDAEQKWMESVKSHDDASLKQLLAADFTYTSDRAAQTFIGKTRYVAHTLRDWKLDSYGFDRFKVRLYGNTNTAVVNGWYKQQAAVGGADWSGNFIFTDVWIKQAGGWKAVSRHLTRLPEVAVKE